MTYPPPRFLLETLTLMALGKLSGSSGERFWTHVSAFLHLSDQRSLHTARRSASMGLACLRSKLYAWPFEPRLHHQFVGAFDHARANGPWGWPQCVMAVGYRYIALLVISSQVSQNVVTPPNLGDPGRIRHLEN